MSYPDLPPLPKTLAAAVLPDSGGIATSDTPSTSKQRENCDMANRHGSLSSTADSISSGEASKSLTVSSTGTTSNESNMDTQLATLRQEMHNLRQMDLSLLTKLWALNESIQGFRARLEDDDFRSTSAPKIHPHESEYEFGHIINSSTKESSSNKSRSHTEGIRINRATPSHSNTKRELMHLQINANHHQEKSIRKTRPK